MLSVTIQPYSYKKINILSDLASVAVLKFSHKSIFDEDFTFTGVYNDLIADLDKNDIEKLFDLLIKNACNNTLITYNSKLFFDTLNVLGNTCNKEIPDEVFEKVPDLMKKFARLHNNGRWAKLEDALQYYDHTLNVDTTDPYDMSEKTIILYRLMQDNEDL